jgi:hypothetical protein
LAVRTLAFFTTERVVALRTVDLPRAALWETDAPRVLSDDFRTLADAGNVNSASVFWTSFWILRT